MIAGNAADVRYTVHARRLPKLNAKFEQEYVDCD